MRSIAPLLAITAAASLFGAGCGGSAATSSAAAEAAGPVRVEIKTFQFQPDPVEVEVGQTIEWTNVDATVHTVVAGTRKRPDREAFAGSLDQDGRFEHTFTEPGTYAYFCDRHAGPGMTAKVVVR